MYSYVSGKKFPVTSPIFERNRPSLGSITGPKSKVNVIGTISGGATRMWALKGIFYFGSCMHLKKPVQAFGNSTDSYGTKQSCECLDFAAVWRSSCWLVTRIFWSWQIAFVGLRACHVVGEASLDYLNEYCVCNAAGGMGGKYSVRICDLQGDSMLLESYDVDADPKSMAFASSIKVLQPGQPYFLGNLDIVDTNYR